MEKRLRRTISLALGLLASVAAFFITTGTGIFSRTLFADGEKTPITLEMLTSSYESYYESSGKAMMIMMLGFGIFLVFLMIFIITLIKRIKKSEGKANKAGNFVFILMLIPILSSFGLIFMVSTCSMSTGPNPAKASYSLEQVTVIRTETEVSTDSDGDKHYSYYAYVVDERRESGERRIHINSSWYDLMSTPGNYYMAKATSGHTSTVFNVYPASGFEPGPGVEVK